MINTKHNFLLLKSNSFPILTSNILLFIIFGIISYINHFPNLGITCMKLGFTLLILVMGIWFHIIMYEGQSKHTNRMRVGIKIAMLLFIASEFMFFFGFFWSYFHSMLVPLNGIWPPIGIEIINPWFLPLLNTFLLLSSGATLTWAHHEMVYESYADMDDEVHLAIWYYTLLALLLTILLGGSFMAVQSHEYLFATFAMCDGVYGSLFFLLTGFHGFHVLVGLVFLTFVLFRFLRKFYKSLNYFTDVNLGHQVLFEIAAWYWHFVDVVWIFLFITIYWYGGNGLLNPDRMPEVVHPALSGTLDFNELSMSPFETIRIIIFVLKTLSFKFKMYIIFLYNQLIFELSNDPTIIFFNLLLILFLFCFFKICFSYNIFSFMYFKSYKKYKYFKYLISSITLTFWILYFFDVYVRLRLIAHKSTLFHIIYTVYYKGLKWNLDSIYFLYYDYFQTEAFIVIISFFLIGSILKLLIVFFIKLFKFIFNISEDEEFLK